MGKSLNPSKPVLPETNLPLPTSRDESLKSVKPALPESSFRWIMTALVLGILVTGGTIVYGLKSTKTGARETPSASPVIAKTSKDEVVSALGRIEPVGEVIKLAATPNRGGAKVARLMVSEGAKVKTGQVVVVMEDYDRKVAALLTARESVKVARANLGIVAAGAKTGEIEAQKADFNRSKAEFKQKISINEASLNTLGKELQGEKIEQQATIQRLEAELKQAQNDYRRYRILAEDGAIALADLEQRGLAVATAQQRLQEAQARLMKTEATLSEKIQEQKAVTQKDVETLYQGAKEAQANLYKVSEVRKVDIIKAESELNLALAQFNQAKADLDTALVKSPIDGQVLKIYTRPGEKVTDADGIADIGRTQQMMVVAEVYESDIQNIKPGQLASIKSENGSFSDELQGQVRVIGLKVGKKDVLGTDPSADIDARVVEVKILLSPESSKKVEGLTYAKVLVKILPQ